MNSAVSRWIESQKWLTSVTVFAEARADHVPAEHALQPAERQQREQARLVARGIARLTQNHASGSAKASPISRPSRRWGHSQK